MCDFFLNDVHFQGESQQLGHVSEQKVMSGSIRTPEITDIRLLDELYATESIDLIFMCQIFSVTHFLKT